MGHSSERLIQPKGLDRASRVMMDGILQSQLKTERIGSLDGLQRAIDLNSQGYGIVILFNHFWIYDGPVVAGQVLHVPEFRKHPSVFPIARHQFDEHRRLLQTLEFLVRGHLMPIVTEDTMKIPKYETSGATLNDGLLPYLRLGAKALQAGGTVGIAPQGGRGDHLDDKAIKPALSVLLKMATQDDSLNIALLTMGIDFKEISHPADYSKFRDLPLGTLTPTVQYGSCTTLGELGFRQDLASKERRLLLDNINVWGLYEMATVVHEDYLAPGFERSKQPNLT